MSEPIKRTNKQDPNINWFTDVYGKLKCSIVHQVPEWSNVKNHLALRVGSQGAFTNAMLRSRRFFSGERGVHTGLHALAGLSRQLFFPEANFHEVFASTVLRPLAHFCANITRGLIFISRAHDR